MAEKQKGETWNLIVGGIFIVALFAAWIALPVSEWLKTFSHWIEGLGFWGYVLFVAVYVLACLVLAPGAPLTIAAGLVFGLAWGFLVVMIGATIGACLAFLVARHLAKEKVESLLEGKPKFAAVEKAISEGGCKVVLLMRLSPLVPFNLQNYFFGVTEIPFWQYAASTFVGIMPGCLLYLYIGATGHALSGGGGDKWGAVQWSFFVAGLIATLAVTLIVGRKAKRMLEDSRY